MRILQYRPRKRLASNIAAFRRELEGRAAGAPSLLDRNWEQKVRERAYAIWEGQGRPENASGECWLKAEDELRAEKLKKALPGIEHALDGATDALNAGDLDGGWKLFHAAQRLELLSLESAELNAVAGTLLVEADKLNPWRKTAVTNLMTVEKGQDQKASNVFRAALLRDEHYNNNAYKDGIRRTTAIILAFALSIGLGTLLVLAWTGFLHQLLPNSPTEVFGIALMGYLGAAFSAVTTVPRPEAHTRIPEVIYSFRVTVLRLLVGPVSAIIIYFVARSDLYESVLKFPPPEGYALLVLAFVAGFTERLVLRVVEAIAGRAA